MDRIVPLLSLVILLVVLYVGYKKVMEYVTILTPFQVTFDFGTSETEPVRSVVYVANDNDVPFVLQQYVNTMSPKPTRPPRITEISKLDYKMPGVVKFTNRAPQCTSRLGDCYYNFNRGSSTRFVRAPCSPPLAGVVETIARNAPGMFDGTAEGVSVTFESCNKIS